MSKWKRFLDIRMDPIYYMITLTIVMILFVALIYR